MTDPLRDEICRLATRLIDRAGIRLSLAGGYGLLLKAEYLATDDLETIAPISLPRATDDLDVILSSEVVVSATGMAVVRDALTELGYEPVSGGEYHQWARPVEVAGVERTVRIDVLGQIPEDRSGVSVKERRMRPHGFSGLHAHPLPEAAFIHIAPLVVPVCSARDGASVEIPHPFSYMILKLFALDDRKDDDRVDRGRHHAFDLYRIVAMLTREEWDRALALREEHHETDVVQRAVEIVRDDFADRDRLGSLRLREHVRGRELDLVPYPLDDFLGDLAELWLST